MVNNKPETWYYGSPKLEDVVENDYVVVLEPDGTDAVLLAYGIENCKVYYVTAPDALREKRARNRKGFDPYEWERRFLDDEKKFDPEVIERFRKLLQDRFIVIDNGNRTKPETKPIPKAAFVQKPLDEGITVEEITKLVGRLECEQVIPIEVQANSSCAIGFISLDAADELNYDYDNLIRNVSEVIEDMDNETEYGNYDFDGFPVYIGY